MAHTSRTSENGEGIPLLLIELTTDSNSRILGGMAIAKVVTRNNLPSKSIEDLLQRLMQMNNLKM